MTPPECEGQHKPQSEAGGGYGMVPEWPLPLPCPQTLALEVAGIIPSANSPGGDIVIILACQRRRQSNKSTLQDKLAAVEFEPTRA